MRVRSWRKTARNRHTWEFFLKEARVPHRLQSQEREK
jgi:hypothetical protein